MGNYSDSENVGGLTPIEAASLVDSALFVVGVPGDTPAYKLRSFLKSQLMTLMPVTKIVAGTNVTISPTSGLGNVTVNASGGGGGIISHTWTELNALVSGGTLVPGQFYRLTNFQTMHQIVGTSTIHTGSTEVLILLATTTTTFSKIAFSESYPNDILEYDFFDYYCEDGTTQHYGWITRRIDTVYGNDLNYDFRNVVWRRWKTTATNYAAGTTYAANAICRYNSRIWKSVQASNTGHTPDGSTASWWTQLIDETVTACVLPYATAVNIGNATLTPDTNTHADFYTFVNYSNLAADASNSGYFTRNIIRGSYKPDDTYIKYKTGNNTVFIRESADSTPRGFDDNNLGGFYENTFICQGMFDNVFVGSLHWGLFASNIITIPGQEFFSNKANFQGNCVGNTFSGGSVHNNQFIGMNAVMYNSFYTKPTSNTLGFYNNSFNNCGQLAYNTFSDVSTYGIFSLYFRIGGDMEDNTFATDGGLDTIIIDVCYHFGHSASNTIISTGHISQMIIKCTGSFYNNTMSSGTWQNVIFNIAGDYTGKTLSATTNKFYSTAITTLP